MGKEELLTRDEFKRWFTYVRFTEESVRYLGDELCGRALETFRKLIEQSDEPVDEELLHRATLSLIKWFHKHRERWNKNELVLSANELVEKILLRSRRVVTRKVG